MTRAMLKTGCVALMLCLADASVASDLRWGVADAAAAASLTSDLNALLEKRAVTGATERAADQPDWVRRALEEDPELSEAWRSDPSETLALIRRIRDAGGLGG